jgi:hypothetical protein
MRSLFGSLVLATVLASEVQAQGGGDRDRPQRYPTLRIEAEGQSGLRPVVAAPADATKTVVEERDHCTAPVHTPDLHTVRAGQRANCYDLDGWCFKRSTFDLRRPESTTADWIFVGTPWIECVRDNRGSCAWNSLGKEDRTDTVVNNIDRVVVHVYTSSRDIGLRVCARIRLLSS